MIAYTVRYEDLLQRPDEVQEALAAALGLVIVHRWSDYPKFIDVSQERDMGDNYSLRPIGSSY